jgi:hypothetical protein
MKAVMVEIFFEFCEIFAIARCNCLKMRYLSGYVPELLCRGTSEHAEGNAAITQVLHDYESGSAFACFFCAVYTRSKAVVHIVEHLIKFTLVSVGFSGKFVETSTLNLLKWELLETNNVVALKILEKMSLLIN